MTPNSKAQWQIHFCVVLWGFTAIIGKLITMPALSLVWWRMLMVAGLLALVPRVWSGARRLSLRLIAAYAGVGILIALHWLTFYSAVKIANASVAVTCIALGTVFLALIEPWIAKRRFDAREVVFGIAVVPGVALVVGGIAPGMRMGVAVGVLSALFVALFGSLNKRLVEHADAFVVTAIEIGSGVIFLTLLAPVMSGGFSFVALPEAHDLILLALLAVFCTLLPFVLSLVALRHMSAFAAQLAVNLEPVYAILLAIPILGEQHELGIAFYAGVVIIMISVLAHPLLERRTPNKSTIDAQSIAQ